MLKISATWISAHSDTFVHGCRALCKVPMRLRIACRALQDRQCTYIHNTEAYSRNHFFHGKAGNITYSVCVPVALVMRHEMRKCLMVLSYVAVWLYDISPCYKCQDFRKKKQYWTCVLFWSVRFRNLHRRPLIRANYFSRLFSYLQWNSGTRTSQTVLSAFLSAGNLWQFLHS